MSSGTSTVSIITSEILRPNHSSHGGTEALSVASSEASSAVGAWSSIAQESYNICASLQALEITWTSGRPHRQRGLSRAPPRRKLAPGGRQRPICFVGALDRRLNVERLRLACGLRAPPRIWTFLGHLAC